MSYCCPLAVQYYGWSTNGPLQTIALTFDRLESQISETIVLLLPQCPLNSPLHNNNAQETRSEVWCKDGSVILQAEDTQGVTSTPDQPTVDECPVVELHDSVVDVKYLLQALYDPHFLGQTALPLVVVGALIRLGRKYDFKRLLDSAVARLTFDNPATLAEYDALFPKNHQYHPTRICNTPGFYFDVLAIARENGILSALPIACYHALHSSVAHLVNGIPRTEHWLRYLQLTLSAASSRARERLLAKQFHPGYPLGWL
ncbi:hypothetical protein K438DRAFT_2021908 [Mycena galopus ATCC 62051]|nr:hypothetical protein K438DRAFT_2021908 [Mycena galopus ATCC 62051]